MKTHTHTHTHVGDEPVKAAEGPRVHPAQPGRVRGHRVNQTTARRDCEKQRCVCLCV